MISIRAAQGTDQSLNRIAGLMSATRQALNDGWDESGAIVSKELVRILTTGPRTGRVYTIRGRKHQASAPGEPPAKLTGALARSVDHKVTGWHTMQVGEEADYAGYLEKGTGRIAPRPHLTVAVNLTKVTVMDVLVRHLRDIHL